MFNRFKKRRPIVYISLGIYLFLISFIIFESCLPSGITGLQSNFFAKISAWFINETQGPQKVKSIKPVEFSDISDSSYLGKDDKGVSQIVVGTTTLLSVKAKYPVKKNNEVYDYSYKVNYISGNRDNYNLIYNSVSNNDTFTTNIRIVANNLTDELYQFNIVYADSLTYEYRFNIVDLAVPTKYESRITKSTIKMGEVIKVDTKLIDESKDDYYLRRYLDESKISRSSLNSNIASIDEYGFIKGIIPGTTTIKYGKYDFDITVTNEHFDIPTSDIKLNISDISNDEPCLLDYDYVFNKGDDPNEYSSLIYVEDINSPLIWKIDDKLKGIVAPYKYDEDGYPIYMDDLNRPCIRLCGYRKKGELNLTCISPYEYTNTESISFNVKEAIPTSMTINIKENQTIEMGKSLTVTASFSPKNSFNNAINVSSNNSNVSFTNNDSTSVIINMNKVGDSTIIVKSIANPELISSFKLKITAKQVINDDNYSDFQYTIRKAAGHFFLFLVTAVFGYIFFYTFIDDIKKLWFSLTLCISSGLGIAGVSELIQYFVPSRTGAVQDVGIDFLGYVIGVLITLGTILIVRAIKNTRKLNSY